VGFRDQDETVSLAPGVGDGKDLREEEGGGELGGLRVRRQVKIDNEVAVNQSGECLVVDRIEVPQGSYLPVKLVDVESPEPLHLAHDVV
jgi:hypothetical protein